MSLAAGPLRQLREEVSGAFILARKEEDIFLGKGLLRLMLSFIGSLDTRKVVSRVDLIDDFRRNAIREGVLGEGGVFAVGGEEELVEVVVVGRDGVVVVESGVLEGGDDEGDENDSSDDEQDAALLLLCQFLALAEEQVGDSRDDHHRNGPDQDQRYRHLYNTLISSKPPLEHGRVKEKTGPPVYIMQARPLHKQMIKYNNKEPALLESQPDTARSPPSKDLLKKINQIFKNSDPHASNPRLAAQSPEDRQRGGDHFQVFPEKRSKSHKFGYEKVQHCKLKREVLRKREEKSSKLDLLIILPNKSEGVASDSHIPIDPMPALNSKIRKFSGNYQGQNKSAVREDIAVGKMRLLTHKSKLKPLSDKSTDCKDPTDPIPRSEQRVPLSFMEKLQTHHNRFIERKEREVRQQYLGNEMKKLYEPGDQYLRLAEEINPYSAISIQSILPNCVLAEKLALQMRTEDKRRITEPNVETSQEFYLASEGNIQTIYDKKVRERHGDFGNELNFSHSKDKIKNYVEKFKASKWKKKVFLANLTKFVLPFETYYYRSLLWKVNYSNQLFVEPPLEYEHRLKVYVGKGNNAPMVRGLISRRYWFAVTDRLEEANFVWTQLKELRYYKVQKPTLSNIPKQKIAGTYIVNSVLLNEDLREFQKYWERNKAVEEHADERLLTRLKCFNYSSVVRGEAVKEGRLHNHLINNYIISNKKSLFRILSAYYRHQGLDPFDFIPITFHVRKGLEDPTFLAFQRYYHQQAKLIRRGESARHNFWIMKPGENSNRGNGIKLCFKLPEIKAIVRQRLSWGDGSDRTHIIQSYIDRPFLYYKRKFDLRHYILISCVNGSIKGYWYTDGYVRTTSSEYTLDISSSNVHLTNDAVQKYLPSYGKYEKGNKLSYGQLDEYIRKRAGSCGFYSHVYPQMRRIAVDIIKASAHYLDPERLSSNFELFGLDFMIDEKLKVWLIEVNSNPCLELSCPLLSTIIPNLIQNVLELTIDALYPPAVRYSAKIPRYLGQIEELNKFQLVFDERVEEIQVYPQGILDSHLLEQEEEQYEDNEGEWEDNL